MSSLNPMACCGMKEMFNIQGDMVVILPRRMESDPMVRLHPEAGLRALVECFAPLVTYPETWVSRDGDKHQVIVGPRHFRPTAAHIVFTEHHGHKGAPYGMVLAKFIKKNGLGTLICTKQAPNGNYLQHKDKPKTNTHHMITCYVWTPDYDKVWALIEPFFPDPYTDKPIPLQPFKHKLLEDRQKRWKIGTSEVIKQAAQNQLDKDENLCYIK